MAGMTQTRAIRVLVIEDHPIMRAGVRGVLSKAPDIEIVGESCNGGEAVGLVLRLRPDVVLLDIGLPDVSGLAVLPMIKAAAGDVRVIMYSCACDEPSVYAAVAAGASGYLVKSAKPRELIDAIRDASLGRAPFSVEASTKLVSALSAAQPAGAPRLTEREREIWAALAQGLTNAEIGRALFISGHTVKFHVHNLLRKLGVRSRSEAICAAHRAGSTALPSRTVR
jgi:two-component system response regulator DevR